MNKVATAFRPYQVCAGVKCPVLVLPGEGSVLRQPLSGIVGIEQVLPRLRILDAHLAKQHVQVVAGHVQFLAYLGDGEARDGVQHMVGIVGTGLELGYLLVASLQRGLHDLERTGHDHFIAFVGTGHHVASLLADAWEDFAGDPMLESLGAIELTCENQRIKAGFVDVSHQLVSAGGRGVTFGYIPLVHQFGDGSAAIRMFQCIAYILGAEKHFALSIGYGADGTELLVLENLDFVHKILSI